MDFVFSFMRTPCSHDVVCVIVDKLRKSVHFIPILMDYPMKKFAKLYIEKDVSLHGVPSNIVSDRDPRFTSHFGKVCKVLWVQTCV